MVHDNTNQVTVHATYLDNNPCYHVCMYAHLHVELGN